MTDKQPAALDSVLRNLHNLKDAIKREAFIEAIRYNAEAQVTVRNEIDWTYNTDQNLPFILEFLEELAQSISLALQSNLTCREELKTTIIGELEGVLAEVPKIVSELATHKAPDMHLDDIEIAHKQRNYSNVVNKKWKRLSIRGVLRPPYTT